MSSESSDRSSKGSSSIGSSSSGRSTSSRSTHPLYAPLIAEIRETSDAESHNGSTVYIKRLDGLEEYISFVRDFSGYSQDFAGLFSKRVRTDDFWKAYNTRAWFILEGKIKLSGGRDCFKKLANPRPGVRTLEAGTGILFKPEEDIHTFGTIHPKPPNDRVTKAHISSRVNDSRGRPTNSIILLRGTSYLIAGDDSHETDYQGSRRPRPELLICHRGRLREAGFEVVGGIERQDLWILDSSGKWLGIQPLYCYPQPLCAGCRQCYASRKWPMPDVCDGRGCCLNGYSQTGRAATAKGYTPALAEAECAGCTVGTYNYERMPLSYKEETRPVERVLNANFTIRNWDHLSEATGHSLGLLVLVFCTVPSLGERLNKKGASFVPWARESGLILGDYLRLKADYLEALYTVKDGMVIEVCTGLMIKFEEDENGVTHVKRAVEDFSHRLPEGVHGYVRLGG